MIILHTGSSVALNDAENKQKIVIWYITTLLSKYQFPENTLYSFSGATCEISN